jgi:DEAD/DEAH box helicase domain-containing protein
MRAQYFLDELAMRYPERLTHIERVPPKSAQFATWPPWLDDQIRQALIAQGIDSLYTHQGEAAELARQGRHTVIATGTASGKSLGYLLPTLTAINEGNQAPNGRGATVLYLAPTKALANDQLRAIDEWNVAGVRAATFDGDSSREDRTWIRQHANYVLTNPDMVHHGILPNHQSWASFLRALQFIVIDECHAYKGVFGSHVAAIVRRLRRVAELYGSSPTVIACSATTANPAASVATLIGDEVTAVVADGSPRGPRTIAFWEPELTTLASAEPVRRTASAETADLLTDLVISDVPTLAFVRSRRGVEAVASRTKDALAEIDSALATKVAAYRGGYLPHERRELESALRSGEITAMAATNALELGIDIAGLDAVLVSGWPGTRASLWQQFGRAGRSGEAALCMFIARDDPLDTYVVHHPDVVLTAPVEATVLDPHNPYVLAPHLCAAAAEQPLTATDAVRWFGPTSLDVLSQLEEQGLLRKRPAGWFWTARERASDLADLRGTGGAPVSIVESETGRLLGTVDAGSAHSTVHQGAMYVHQGESYLVDAFNVEDAVAFVQRIDVDYTTMAREISEITIVETRDQQAWGAATLNFGIVDVTARVVSYQRRRILTGEVMDEHVLDLPARDLRTAAVWWTVTDDQWASATLTMADLGGAAHAAEHASIGLMPLFATCDRWDIGGVSTALHPDTGQLTVFVYDGHAGGAGFAERGFHIATKWLQATHDLIAACPCSTGCPSCIQSPKCGNGNEPLDKDGALRLLQELLSGAPRMVE